MVDVAGHQAYEVWLVGQARGVRCEGLFQRAGRMAMRPEEEQTIEDGERELDELGEAGGSTFKRTGDKKGKNEDQSMIKSLRARGKMRGQ